MSLGKWTHIFYSHYCKNLADTQCLENYAVSALKTVVKGSETSYFFVFMTRHYMGSHTVRARGSGCHLNFVGDRVQMKQDMERISYRCLGNLVSAMCGSKWLTGILEYSRLLLRHYRVFLLTM